jgi:hypothetical protein
MAAYRSYKNAVLFGGGFICAVYLLNVVAVYTFYCGPRKDSQWTEAILGVKEAYAESVDGPKVVLVAGSSVHYGLSAKSMEAALDVPVVNLGTHGALYEYSYVRAKRSLSSGDLVIVAPEYSMYDPGDLHSAVRSDYLVNFDKAYLKSRPLLEQFEILQGFLNPVRGVERNVDYIRKRDENLKKERYFGSVNENGDETKNVAYTGDIYPAISFTTEMDPKSPRLKELSNFIDWCRGNEVQVLVTWPATLKFKEAPLNAVRIAQTKTYWRSHEIEVIGEPEDFFCEPELLFDTQYHLNLEGVAWRTSLLLEMLRESPGFKAWIAGTDQN